MASLLLNHIITTTGTGTRIATMGCILTTGDIGAAGGVTTNAKPLIANF